MELTSIGFIPDGNRRYASKVHRPLVASYQMGTKKAWQVLDWLNSYPKIKFGTFYTLSMENLSRNFLELKVLFKVFERELDRVWNSDVFTGTQTRLKFIGRLNLFPEKLVQKMHKAEEFTENLKKRTVYLAMGYNGQAEIADAAKRIAFEAKEHGLDPESISPETFRSYLYSDFPSPDLIVRTGGTKRLSGFLTYQSSYAELYFLDKFWPEFTQQDLALAVSEFRGRERRFGK